MIISKFKPFLPVPKPRIGDTLLNADFNLRMPTQTRIQTRMQTIILLIIALLATNSNLMAQKRLVYKIDIKKEIDRTTQIYLNKGLAEAQSLDADAVLIHLNTYGGLLEAADSMRTAILYSPIPV